MMMMKGMVMMMAVMMMIIMMFDDAYRSLTVKIKQNTEKAPINISGAQYLSINVCWFYCLKDLHKSKAYKVIYR